MPADDGVATGHRIGCQCIDCILEAWSHPNSSKHFRDFAEEMKRLRGLVDEQINAMSNTPMGDMNYAGIDWLQRARNARRQP